MLPVPYQRKIADMNYWLVKSEPSEYSFSDLEKEEVGCWDGVRNYQARNNLRSMKLDDEVFFYHSRQGLEIVGLARVVREAYPDPTAEKGDWSAVDLSPVKWLKEPVSLKAIKAESALADIAPGQESQTISNADRPGGLQLNNANGRRGNCLK